MPEIIMGMAATEAVRIARIFFPDDFSRQRDLATEIVQAISLCETESARRATFDPQKPTRDMV